MESWCIPVVEYYTVSRKYTEKIPMKKAGCKVDTV